MRHLGSLIAGIVVGIVAWVLIGVAQARIGSDAVNGINTHSWGHYSVALLLMAIAGLLIGLIASTRVSPIGPFVAGAAYVLLQLAYVTWPHFLNWLPGSMFGQHDIWTRPMSSGVFALLGLVLLVGVLSLRRWQRWPKRTAAAEPGVVDTTADTTAGTTAEPDRDVVERRRFPIGTRRSRGVPADEAAAPTAPEETTAGPATTDPTMADTRTGDRTEARPAMEPDPVHQRRTDI
jgi:hypothetical protein